MFEKEIKFIGDFSFNQIRSLGNSFTLEKMISTGIHPAIVQYISAELEYMIYSDRKRLLQQSYFDYTGKEISDYFQKISGEIKKQKKISVDDAKKLIFQAVSFNINYLVRPRWSLIKLIFNDQPVISVEEMKMMFNYLYYYEYFKKVLIGYIEKRNLLQLSSTEFDIILDKIDRELLNSNQRQVISNSFTSIGDFFNIGGVDKTLLPLSAVEIFCKEKNLLDLIVKLRKVIPNDIKRRYDKGEIERILFTPSTEMKVDKIKVEETEINTDKMVEAIDNVVEFSEPEPISDELEKSEIETFLSPEEEEALLSLYSTESETVNSVSEETILEIKDEIPVVEPPDTEKVESNVSVEEPIENLDDNIDDLATEPEFPHSADLKEIGIDKIDSFEVESYEEIVSTDEELNEIVDAISDDYSKLENEIVAQFDNGITESPESESESETELPPETFIESGVEKEIAQEMINDFYGGNQPEPELETITENLPEEIQQPVTEFTEENENLKIQSLENDLLNIFEGLDKIEFQLPEKGKQFEDTSEADLNPVEEPVTPTSEPDSFDDYLKSIDELMFTEKQKSPEKTQTVENKNSLTETITKTEVKEAILPSKETPEQQPVKTRIIRPKDLFSYLRRKEAKKIIAYIFSNDEEDFTNTIERIMDCNSYKEASDILKAVFTSYKISPYSKEAITFTNAVSNYFRQA